LPLTQNAAAVSLRNDEFNMICNLPPLLLSQKSCVEANSYPFHGHKHGSRTAGSKAVWRRGTVRSSVVWQIDGLSTDGLSTTSSSAALWYEHLHIPTCFILKCIIVSID